MYCGHCGALLSDSSSGSSSSEGENVLCPACGVDQTTGPDDLTSSENWYFLRDDRDDQNEEQQGPYPFPVILSEIHTGHITEATLVWYPGLDMWLPAGQTGLIRYL